MKKLILLSVLLTIFNGFILAQNQSGKRTPSSEGKSTDTTKLELDLASPINSLVFSVKNNTPVELTILSLLPTKNYSIDIVTQGIIPPALEVPSERQLVDGCTGYDAKFKAAKSEIEFRDVLNSAKKDCPELYQYYHSKSTREFKLGTFTNEKKIITVTDHDNHKWIITIETELDGKVVVLYGFSFIPYSFSKPRTYYALPLITTPGSYTIGRGSSESRFEYAPTVAFHYIDRNANNFSSSFSLGLGVGFNSSNTVTPVVIVGYSALIYKSYGINLGIAAHSINRLKAKYTDGQVITTNLESADLTEKVIRFNPVISFTYRFGSWPFSQKNEAGSTTINP